MEMFVSLNHRPSSRVAETGTNTGPEGAVRFKSRQARERDKVD